MDELQTSLFNFSLGQTVSALTVSTTPAALCRDRSGHQLPSRFNAISCGLCFVFVYMGHDRLRSSFDEQTLELSIYPNITVSNPDPEDTKLTSVLCGALSEDQDCDKWKSCCLQARACCQEQLAANSQPVSDLNRSKTCPRTWDGLHCWPQVSAGSQINLECPAYVPNYYPSGQAYKVCTDNGTWELNSNNKEWTDYTKCSFNDLVHTRQHTALIVTNLISISSMVPASIIFLFYRPLRQQQRIKLHLCLMFSAGLTSLFLLLYQFLIYGEGLQASSSEDVLSESAQALCRPIKVLILYSESCVFMWMFAEGFHLHRLLVHAFTTPKSLIPYYLIGFGVPIVPVTIYSTLRATMEQFNDRCWTDDDESVLKWITILPNLLALLVNVLFLLRIIFIMVRQLEPHPNEPSSFRRALKATVVLVPLFGLQALVFLYQPNLGQFLHELYIVTTKVISGLQGCFIALVLCYLNKEVQGHLRMSFLKLTRPHKRGSDWLSCTLTTQVAESGPHKWSTCYGEDTNNMIALGRMDSNRPGDAECRLVNNGHPGCNSLASQSPEAESLLPFKHNCPST